MTADERNAQQTASSASGPVREVEVIIALIRRTEATVTALLSTLNSPALNPDKPSIDPLQPDTLIPTPKGRKGKKERNIQNSRQC